MKKNLKKFFVGMFCLLLVVGVVYPAVPVRCNEVVPFDIRVTEDIED